jgi:hypothetical protein
VGDDVNGSWTWNYAADNTSAATIPGVLTTRLTLRFTPGNTVDFNTQNMTVSVVVTPDTITVTPRDTFKIYNGSGADPAIPYTVTDKGGHDVTGVTGTFGREAGDNAGDYALTAGSGWILANHVFVFDISGAKFTIVPDTITVKARDTSKIYGTPDPALPFDTTKALLAGNRWAGALSRTAGDTVRAGGYAIGVGTLTAGGNYHVNFVGGTFTIVPDTLTVKARDTSKVYNGSGSDPAIPYTVKDKSGHDVAGVNGTFGREPGNDAGAYALTAGSGWASTNYVLAFDTAGVRFRILPKSVTITGLGAKDKVYDGNADAAITGAAAVDGLLPGDDLAVVWGTASFDSERVGAGKTVAFSGFSLTGADTVNYRLAAQPASVEASINGALIFEDYAFTWWDNSLVLNVRKALDTADFVECRWFVDAGSGEVQLTPAASYDGRAGTSYSAGPTRAHKLPEGTYHFELVLADGTVIRSSDYAFALAAAPAAALQVYPNPLPPGGVLRVALPSVAGTAGTTVKIYDMLGRLVGEAAVPAGAAVAELHLRLPVGAYILQTASGETVKFVVKAY